jgi:hypothetical protein
VTDADEAAEEEEKKIRFKKARTGGSSGGGGSVNSVRQHRQASINSFTVGGGNKRPAESRYRYFRDRNIVREQAF